METTEQVAPEQDKIRVNVKISAKGEPHGEYTFRGNTADEAALNGEVAKRLFRQHTEEMAKQPYKYQKSE